MRVAVIMKKRHIPIFTTSVEPIMVCKSAKAAKQKCKELNDKAVSCSYWHAMVNLLDEAK